ncbi:hypothetical protein YN1_3730 [Nanoarchaeota archaeon]
MYIFSLIRYLKNIIKYMEVSLLQVYRIELNNIPKEIDNFLNLLLESNDLIYSVKSNIINFIILLSKYYYDLNINNSKEEDIKEVYIKIKEEKDELLREILNSIITFEYWKTKYYKENKEKYFEQVLKNIDKIFKEIELSLWMLLYLKNKEKVLNYKDYIEKLSNEVLLSSDLFIEESEDI